MLFFFTNSKSKTLQFLLLEKVINFILLIASTTKNVTKITFCKSFSLNSHYLQWLKKENRKLIKFNFLYSVNK